MSIKSKLIIFALCISLIPISIITTLYYFNVRNELKRQNLQELSAIAESKRIHVKSFMEARCERTIDFSSDGFIRKNLGMINNSKGLQNHIASRLNKHLVVNKKPLATHIAEIAILDINGKVVASTAEKWIGKDMSELELFRRCKSKNYGETYIGMEYSVPFIDTNCIFISAPLISIQHEKKTIGIIITAYELDSLNEITANREGMGKTGEVYVVNKDKLMITESRFIENAVLNQIVDTKPAFKLLENSGGMTSIYADYRNVPVVGASVNMPEYGWILMAKVDKAEAFGRIADMKTFSLIIGGASALVVIAISIILSKRSIKPILKLAEGTRRIAKGDLAFRIETVKKDEIGQLVTSFNEMTSQLEDSKKKLHDYTHNLEEKVEDKTKEIKQMLDELTDKNKEMEQFLYVASHDLRSPLLNIQGFSNELQQSVKILCQALNESGISSETREKLTDVLEEDIPEALRFIQASSSKMDKLLSGLLRLSRTGRVTLNIRQLDMNKLISDVIETYKYAINEAKVTCRIEDLPSCRGDEGQINQVFSNLIDNALKYLDNNREGIIGISGRREDGQSVYCIEDNGIGIEEKHQDYICEIWDHVNPDDSAGGEGLGLVIVCRILNRHGGKIWVESEAGKGCKFFVSLPA